MLRVYDEVNSWRVGDGWPVTGDGTQQAQELAQRARVVERLELEKKTAVASERAQIKMQASKNLNDLRTNSENGFSRQISNLWPTQLYTFKVYYLFRSTP